MRSARFTLVCFALAVFCGGANGQTPPAKATAPPVPLSAGTPLPGIGGQAFAGNEQADPNSSVILDNADTFEQTEPGKWIGRGHVKVRYKQYVLTSDQVDVDLDAGEALFTGNVVMTAPNGETVRGGKDGSLRLNLRHNTYDVLQARTTIPASDLSTAGIILPIFVYGGEISGRPGLIDARESRFTTCDFLQPHYEFGARSVTIIPDKRLVARRVTLYRKGRAIFAIPYFVVPLTRRNVRQTLLPQVGQSPDEGYFAKFAFGYALAASLPGILRIDALQKKGLGTGFEQNYGTEAGLGKGAGGLLSLYRLYDKQQQAENLTGSLEHHQTFGTVAAELNSQFQQNSYFVGAQHSRSLTSDLNLTRAVGNLNTSLRTNLSSNDYGQGASENLTSALQETFRPTSREQLQTQFNYSQYQSPTSGGFLGASNRKELDSSLDYTQQGKLFDLEVLGNNYAQLRGGQTGGSFYGGLERLPELRLVTDAARQPWLRQLFSPSSRLNLSLGEFHEPSSETRTQRADFGLDLGSITRKLNARNTLDFGGAFQQRFYGDNTAQYILNGRSAYRLKIGSKSSAGVTYTYLRPYGFTPLQLDFVGSTNTTAFSFGYQETKQFALTLATAYDLNRTRSFGGQPAAPWQNLSAQALFAPNDIFQLRTNAAYDINRARLLDLTNSLRVRAPGGIAIDLATRYAPDQHKFSNINGRLDLPFFRDPSEDAGYRLRAIGGYNGYSNKFEYRGLALTRSWHDWQATLIYQDDQLGLRPGSTVTFNFRLKAFPDVEPFAVGQFGQSLDTGIGQVY